MQSQLLPVWLGAVTLTSFPLSWLALLWMKDSLTVSKFHTSQITIGINTGMKLKLQDSLFCIQWIYFKSWLSKRSFQDLSCSLYSCTTQFVSQTESTWTLWTTRVLFVNFVTEVLLTYIQIHIKIPKYQAAACRHIL